MGTRHLTCVLQGGEFKVAQYGQWDGYPSGQGATILGFLQSADMELFRQRIGQLRAATHEEILQSWTNCGADPESLFVNMEVSRRHGDKYPQFCRDTGAEILRMIYDGLVESVDLRTEFAKDSLFCEWCYVINLDTNELEVMRGFQKEPHSKGRFASDIARDGYYPVALLKSWPLDALPATVADFVAALEPKDEMAEA